MGNYDDTPRDGHGRPLAVRVATMQEHVKQLQAHDSNHALRISALEEAVIEHRMRLENGVKVFADINAAQREFDQRTKPRPVSITKVVSITITLITLGIGALWGLSTKLSDRPTVDQLERALDRHGEHGHLSTQTAIGDIKEEQAAQRTLIESVREDQRSQGAVLNEIRSSLPARSRRRNPP